MYDQTSVYIYTVMTYCVSIYLYTLPDVGYTELFVLLFSHFILILIISLTRSSNKSKGNQKNSIKIKIYM